MIGRFRPPVRPHWTVQYMQRVLATDPIAYWMQDEKQGGVSYDMVTARSDGARNGAYTAVILGQPGIGDGRTSALFDGATSVNAIRTASFAAAFDGDEGSAVLWVRLLAGVWIDGGIRYALAIRVDANNVILLAKSNVNNNWQFTRGTLASGALSVNHVTSTLASFSVGLTWSLSAGASGELRAFFNGVQTGATQVNIGAWAGVPAAVLTALGALSTVPSFVTDGILAHGIVWARPISPAEMLSVGVL